MSGDAKTPEKCPEGAQERAAESAPAGPAPKRRMLMTSLVGGLVLGGAGLGVYLYVPGPWSGSRRVAAAEAQESKKVADVSVNKVQVVTLKPIVVNLRNSKGMRYLKVTLGMETNSEAAASELQSASPRLSDFLIDKLAEVEISDVDTSAGRNKLKREILTGTNELLAGGYVNAVYFTEFVIQ